VTDEHDRAFELLAALEGVAFGLSADVTADKATVHAALPGVLPEQGAVEQCVAALARVGLREPRVVGFDSGSVSVALNENGETVHNVSRAVLIIQGDL